MTAYWLRLFPEQPLQLDDPSLITARALRGAIASVARRTCLPNALHEHGPCQAGCIYWPLFAGARAAIRFGDGYATTHDDLAPFAATVRTCALHPGFKTNGAHGVLDVAIRGWTFEQTWDHLARLPLPFEMHCAVCGAPLVACEGLLIRRSAHDFAIAEPIAMTPTRTEHRPLSRERWRGANVADVFAQDGTLLTRSAYYCARLDVPDALDTLLRSVLAEGVLIGGRRTRGMGAVRVELAARPILGLTLHDRINEFNRVLRAERRFYTSIDETLIASDEGCWYFIVDFLMQTSYDKQPAPLADIRALRRVSVIRQWLTHTLSEGRNTATGMPIGAAHTVSGTALYRVPPDEDRAALEQALTYLETNGLGLDRACSRLTVCDPFHLELAPL